ncbi:unnamed protein product, partial [Protopolystoma xenopodis]
MAVCLAPFLPVHSVPTARRTTGCDRVFALSFLRQTHSANRDPSESADLSTVFDWGGIAGGVLAGLVSDRTQA